MLRHSLAPKWLLAAFLIVPHEQELCRGFLPDNDWRIPVHSSSSRFGAQIGNLTEDQFKATLKRVETLYLPDVAALGGKLFIWPRWNEDNVNARATRYGTFWYVHVFGGIARFPSMTTDGLALVTCHELGHHLGGLPKTMDWLGNDWATNEGGADYFATLKCLRRVFSQDDVATNGAIVENHPVSDYAWAKCDQQFSDQLERLVCKRSAIASLGVAKMFQQSRNEPQPPSFETPDLHVVPKTDNAHPATQCRLDTFFAGALCAANPIVPLSNSDPNLGACALPSAHVGIRPACWFASK
jgi:hypothetical protein